MTGSVCAAALCRRIDGLLERRDSLLVAIDGRCAAGKTTLAQELEQARGWSVIHMDHFFLRPEQRTPERYATPGENIDHERFQAEVLLPLRAGKGVAYRPFDCQRSALGEAVSLKRTPVVVIEGAYACHPSLREDYDLRVFMDVGPQEQLRRLKDRAGPERLADFRTRWIPMEEAYLSACTDKTVWDLSVFNNIPLDFF